MIVKKLNKTQINTINGGGFRHN